MYLPYWTMMVQIRGKKNRVRSVRFLMCGSMHLVGDVLKNDVIFYYDFLLTFIKNNATICYDIFVFKCMLIFLMFFAIAPIFFIIACIGVPFYFMMEFFSCFIAKKFANLDKKVIGILSFAMSALIYSLLPFMLGSPVSFQSWRSFLFSGLMLSVPFYSILWFFLRTFKKRFPNQSDESTYSGKNFLTSFSITALIFSFIFCTPFFILFCMRYIP